MPRLSDCRVPALQRERIHTIQDALEYISHPQTVQVTAPARPGVTIEASQQVLIEALPPILVLHLKRFLYDTSVGGVVKLGRQIRFAPELEVGPGVSFFRNCVVQC
jgi:ubiquitin carboxyl-terminal hydrolase 10